MSPEFDPRTSENAKKKANRYHFEDLSQFVHCPQQEAENVNPDDDDDDGHTGADDTLLTGSVGGAGSDPILMMRLMHSSSLTDDDDLMQSGAYNIRKYIRMRSADEASSRSWLFFISSPNQL